MRSISQVQTPAAPAAAQGHAAPAAPVTAPPPSASDFLALQQQASQLSYQVAGLRAQRSALAKGISGTSGAARVQLRVQAGQLDVQIAESQALLENLRSQIAERSQVSLDRVSSSGQILIPPPHQKLLDPKDVDAISALSLTFMLIVILPMSIAVARRIARGGKPRVVGPNVDELAPKIDRLERAVDVIAIEIERISENQRFMTKVMTERPAPAGCAGESNGAGAPADGVPAPRALGAGPAERVHLTEHEAARVRVAH